MARGRSLCLPRATPGPIIRGEPPIAPSPHPASVDEIAFHDGTAEITRARRLTANRAWLRSGWPRVGKDMSFIEQMQRETLSDPNAQNAVLVSAGFSDGGLGGVAA